MIRTKEEYKYYIMQDAKAQRRKKLRVSFVGDYIWKFQLYMRKLDYYDYKRKNSFLYKLLFLCYKFLYVRQGLKLGFSLPFNVFGPGLSIAHWGTIVVNGGCKIGKNCRIHACVNIGVSGSSAAPRIGDNVYIGPGVKIVGDIEIADGVCLGAGAVVVKSITEPNTTWGGVPAKKLSDNSSRGFLSSELFED